MSGSGVTFGPPGISGTAITRVKHSFSRQHLVAARFFAAQAEVFEAKGSASEEEKSQHRAYVTGAVVFSVAFLEASINEFYLEAIDRNRSSLAGLTDTRLALVGQLWESVERGEILSKYQIALTACGVEPLTKGTEPFQGAAVLIKMRNALTHYRPEWEDELDVHAAIEKSVRGRFPLNALSGSGSLWFPHRCLGAGCARWADSTVTRFIEEFCTKLSIPSRLPPMPHAGTP
jgi:hypothetical protein